MLIGAHLSVSDGYGATVDYARQVGAECMQIFAKSPRQWAAKCLDPDRAAELGALCKVHSIGPVFTHTAYLINLSTDDAPLREKSIAALADEIVRGAALGAAGVVSHVGNDPTSDPRAAAIRSAEAIEKAFAATELGSCSTRLLLENTAGAGRSFGADFEEMGWVLAALGPATRAKVGVCLDTCHAHAYGIDLSTDHAWELLLDEIDATCGPNALGLVHANDCKFERGSRKDRHEWIGQGFLGEESFQAMLCAARLRDVPAVTEMPGEPPEKDKVNIDRLKQLRATCR